MSALAAVDCTGASPAGAADARSDVAVVDAGGVVDAGSTPDAPLPPLQCHSVGATAPCDAGANDGAPPSDWPGWQRIVGLDPCCVVDAPIDLDAAAAPLTWIACPDQPIGCLQLANPPDAGLQGNPYIRTATVSQDATGAAKYLEIRWALSQDASLVQDTIFDVATGSVVSAIRNNSGGCYAPFDVAGESAALFAQSVVTGNIFFGQGTVRTIFAPPSFECIWTTPPGGLDFMQEHAISDTTFAFDTTDYTVFRTNGDGGWAATYQAGSQGAQLGLLLDFVAKNDVYAFTNDNGFQREYLVQPDGTPVLYRAVTNRFVTAVATDGTTMFWTESYGASTPGGTPTSFEAWAAPYTNDPATLEATARRVAIISGTNPPIAATAAAGLYAIGASVTNDILVRLSDGAIHNFTPASSNPLLRLFDVTYVAANEIWVIVKTDQLTTNYLRRYDLGTW